MEISTALNNPPATPELLTPEDGAIDLENSVELIWSSSDPEEDPIEYRIEIKNDFNSDVISINSLTDTTYVVSDLKFGGKYFWYNQMDQPILVTGQPDFEISIIAFDKVTLQLNLSLKVLTLQPSFQ